MSKFLYTVSNRRSANSVIGMEIQDGGDLRFVRGSPFVTGGKGSRSSQSQNGIWIDRDLIYAVDFGSSSVAIFRKQSDGTLTRIGDPVESHGISPCSVCVSDDILYVVNQHIRSSGGKAEPNLSVFAVKGSGVRFLENSSFSFPRGESPTQAIVNPQGTILAIPSVRTRRSLLHCYAIQRGAAAGPKLAEFENSPFAITDTGFGFGSVWKSDGRTFFMTNATGTGSVVRLDVDIKSRRITEKARATTPGNACWAALLQNEKRLYVANLLSLLVFDVSGNRLEQIQSLDVTDVKVPVLRDLIVAPGGKFLYALEQRKRRILIYSVDGSGRVTRSGEFALRVPGYTLGLAIG